MPWIELIWWPILIILNPEQSLIDRRYWAIINASGGNCIQISIPIHIVPLHLVVEKWVMIALDVVTSGS